MKPLTTSVYTFSDLIAGGYLYVDKTSHTYKRIRGYKGQYFLARLRRFGNSLLVSTNISRIAAVVKMAKDIFIFEFKLHGTVEEALSQLRDLRYAERYHDDGRRVTLIGVAFDPAERNLGKWRIEAM